MVHYKAVEKRHGSRRRATTGPRGQLQGRSAQEAVQVECDLHAEPGLACTVTDMSDGCSMTDRCWVAPAFKAACIHL
jgi:hypothetical protein